MINVECDIRVPEHLYEHFSEMCPIFKNIDIHGTKDVIGEHMADYCTTNNKQEITQVNRLHERR